MDSDAKLLRCGDGTGSALVDARERKSWSMQTARFGRVGNDSPAAAISCAVRRPLDKLERTSVRLPPTARAIDHSRLTLGPGRSGGAVCAVGSIVACTSGRINRTSVPLPGVLL